MRIVKTQSPEEAELASKRAELAALQRELIELELDLSTLEQELAAFRGNYLRIVGRRYAVLDDIKARIAEGRAARHPADDEAQQEARRTREAAEQTAQQVSDSAPGKPVPAFAPPASLRTLFRAAARTLHPDLAPTEEDRSRRHEWMAKVNEAYKREDEEALKRLVEEWEASPESVEGTGVATELVRVIRQIAQARRSIANIRSRIEEVKETELYSLCARHRQAEDEGRNLLEEIAADLDVRIADAKAELAELNWGNSDAPEAGRG